MSCRGWSSDAYWAARMTRELARRGHLVTLGCRAGTEAQVIDRARREGVDRIDHPVHGERRRPVADSRDRSALRALTAGRRRRPRAPGQGALAGGGRQSPDRRAAAHRADAPHRAGGATARGESLALSARHRVRRDGHRRHPASVHRGRPGRPEPGRRAAGRRRYRALPAPAARSRDPRATRRTLGSPADRA